MFISQQLIQIETVNPKLPPPFFNNVAFCYIKCEDMDFGKKVRFFFLFSYGSEKSPFWGFGYLKERGLYISAVVAKHC